MADKDLSSAARTPGPELRLVDRRAFVGFPELTLAPGVVVTDFALQIPDVTFPLNVSGGASKYQKKKLDFGLLELSIDAEVIARAVRAFASKVPELDEVKLHFRAGSLEAQARLRGPERTPVTFKIAFDGDGERLAVYLYDVRLYSFSTTPAARLGAILSEAVKASAVLPEVERRGANGFTARILPAIVEQAAVARGYKMPSLDQARLAEAVVTSKGLRLRFSSGGLPPPGTPDEELLLALEGARAFAEAEELLAQNRLQEARAAYLVLGDATEAHPFAVERLLSLLVADLQAHELALDVAASLAHRRERSATAIWAEAVVRERRGEFARASERYLALCSLARRNQEEASSFFAAEAAARASRDHAPQLAVKALHELLGLKPDHLPSLKALARASDQASDRAGAIRAYRRLAALARDSADAADAHVQLARLCAQTEDDIAGARLHCEAALRLAPDHPEALFQLGQLCYRSGEWLRAIKALDRLREVAMGRHEVDRVGRANLLAGLVWETGLKQPENALLRFREAASLMPGEPEPLALAARVAESLGKVQEAVAGYQQAIELAGPAPRSEDVRKAAHASHHALARLLKTRLGEPARARDHLEAALALDPQDKVALDELLPYFRASGKAAELADACEKAAAVIDDPVRRSSLWAEAGELYRGRLNQAEKAERLLSQALEADPKNRLALEGMLALAESRRDGGQLCRCLAALAQLAEDGKERVRYSRRLAVAARDLAFDLELASNAYRAVLKVEPDDLPVLGELTALERRRADMPGLAWALEQRARVAESLGDKRLASAALRELSQVLDARLGRAGEALVALEKSTRLFPEPNSLLELASLSLRVERPINARRALEDVLALLPKHAPPEKLAEVRARLGRACELLGDKDAARENYALAFPLRRLDDELAGRLEALYLEGRFTRELTDLWAARAQALLQAGRAQDAAPLFFRAAQKALETGDGSGAMLRLTAALDAAPAGEQAKEILELMASLELKRGESMESARLSARRAALSSGRDAARWYFRAATLAKDSPREAGFLAQTLEADSAYMPGRLRRAELIEFTNPREALVDFEAVLGASSSDEDTAGLTFDSAALTRRAALAAQKSGQYDAARRLFGKYTALKPDDVEAQVELVGLHRRAGALEPLVDLLGELWPRLTGAAKTSARREYAEGALSLGRSAAAVEALRSMLVDVPQDEWAASRLLTLLPADDVHVKERLELLSRLVEQAQGEARAELLARRAELWRVSGELGSARADLLEAAQLTARPLPLLRALAEYARQAHDEQAELAAWKLVLEKAAGEGGIRQDAGERLAAIARNRVTAEDFTRALDAFEALVTIELHPTERFEAWYGLAQSARAVGSLKRAEQALLEASKEGPAPRRVDALLERATLLENRQALTEAVDAWNAALALAPRHETATAGVLRALRTLGDWEGLAEVLAVEAQQRPRTEAIALHTELASIYLDRLKELGPGEAALRKIIALEPGSVEARARLAGLLVARGELAEAITLLEEAADRQDGAPAATLLREAAAHARTAGDASLELKLMRKAHALVPATGAGLERLAEALYLRGAVREALPLQQQVTASTPFQDDPEAAERTHLRLADLAEQAEDFELAERTLKLVTQERPLNSQAVERLASLVARRDPRGALVLVAKHLESLGASPRSAERLMALGREALERHGDVELATRLFTSAAEGSDEPLSIRLELVELLRGAGRTAELMTELNQVAQLRLTSGEVELALDAWDEEARLAEGSGRIDDALRTLTAMSEVCEEEGLEARAAALLVRLAELQRDSKLDLDAAAASLDRAWGHAPTAALAGLGLSLAQRRGDREAEIDWLERSLQLAEAGAQAPGFVQLARLHLGLPIDGGPMASAPMLAPDQAEAALRRALELDPASSDAEAMLIALLERLERPADVALWYEDSAARTREPKARAALLLKAALIYKDQVGRPTDAAAALLAARAANPDDLSLTTQAADLLVALGRRQDAADFEAVLLEHDPFHPSFARHAEWLSGHQDFVALAMLLSRRAERQTGPEAAQTWLEAAHAFQQGGADERAQLCQTQAFDADPRQLEAFTSLFERAKDDPRRQAELLSARAQVVPGEASALLRQRAELLATRGDPLLASAAWDDYLALIPDDLRALEVRAQLAAQGGGPRAAQPFDRRLVQLGGDPLPLETRLVSWVRLGQAAVESQAWRDAIDAFEQVHALDEAGPRGAEALTLLSEAYGRLRDAEGQYRTTLKVAARSTGEETEALYRRALSLRDEPEQAWEALSWLLERHPASTELHEKGVLALTRLGRVGELVALHERHAAAVGGRAGSEALLAAANLVERELHDGARAFELRQEASRLDPDNLEAVEAVLIEARRVGPVSLVEAQLRHLAAGTTDETRASELWLELATSLEARGELTQAREALLPIRRRGTAAAGFSQALTVLERLARASNDSAALADAQLASAELLSAPQRASRLLDVARTWQEAGELERALQVTRDSLAAHASRAGFTQLVDLARLSGRHDELARSLVQLSAQVDGVERAVLLLQAVEAWKAAGDARQAREIFERVLSELPGVVSADAAATKFLELGAPGRALELGFAAALASGRAARALELADAACDATRAHQALQVLAFESPGSADATRYLGTLRTSGDLDALFTFARAAQASVPAVAVALWRELALGGRVDALEALAERGELGSIAAQATERGSPEVLAVLVEHAATLELSARERLFTRVAEVLPARRPAMLRALTELYGTERRFTEQVQTLAELAQLEEHPAARASLHVDRGTVLSRQLGDAPGAIAAFERALLEDSTQLAAVRELVELYRAGPADKFIGVVERLRTLAGPQSIASFRESLAEAYEAVGRTREAYQLLGQLDATEARVRRRAALADGLGLGGEALALREQIATSREELEQILRGYLEADLVPFAVRLGERLMGEAPLAPHTQRLLAERLAPTAQGAKLATVAWRQLLAGEVVDTDGWTLLAEAYRKLGDERAAALADGFGAALSSTSGPASPALLRPLPGVVDSSATAPADCVDIDEGSMPRLSAALLEILATLGAEGVQPVLDTAGGVELWLAGHKLVLGAGALSMFGQAELPFAVALALRLGTAGAELRQPSTQVPGFDDAVRTAFDASPASLAAARVIAQYDASVRGSDPSRVDVGAVLRTSGAFRALALRALEKLGTL